jgi:hypothetical protein
VLAVLPDHPHAAPLRRALQDELGAIADQAGTVLALPGGRAVQNAAQALRAGRERGLALELLESAAGRDEVELALTLLDPAIDQPGRLERLAAYAPAPADLADWLTDLVLDQEDRWHSSWLRTCALYAAPTVLGDTAARLAEQRLDDPDPAVAETARWVLAEASQRDA